MTKTAPILNTYRVFFILRSKSILDSRDKIQCPNPSMSHAVASRKLRFKLRSSTDANSVGGGGGPRGYFTTEEKVEWYIDTQVNLKHV